MRKSELRVIKEAFKIVIIEENDTIDKAIAAAPTPSKQLYQKCDATAREIIEEEKHIPTRKIISLLVAATLIISIFSLTAYAVREKIGVFLLTFLKNM